MKKSFMISGLVLCLLSFGAGPLYVVLRGSKAMFPTCWRDSVNLEWYA